MLNPKPYLDHLTLNNASLHRVFPNFKLMQEANCKFAPDITIATDKPVPGFSVRGIFICNVYDLI